MSKKILGLEAVYKRSIDQGPTGNMLIAAHLVTDMVEYIRELENAVIDLRAAVLTCKNASEGALLQYKDL
jgi:hypothetical protein